MGDLVITTSGDRSIGDVWSPYAIGEYDIVRETSTVIELRTPEGYSPLHFTFYGFGFTYGPNGEVTGGTITGMDFDGVQSGSWWAGLPDASWTETVTLRNISVNAADAYNSLTGIDQPDIGALLLGDDVVGSTALPDFLVGGGGADTISGGAGDDVIRGRYNPAAAVGAAAYLTPDRVAADHNYLRGDEGNDFIDGGFGFDDINGNMGNDTAHGGLGDDWVVGGKDQDQLFGDDGGDIVYGNLGNDTCDGGSDADLVRGGQGDDIVKGGDGNDWLSGDRGNDTITGGAGADVFHGSQDAGIDRVTDFHLDEGDSIRLDPGTTYSISQVGSDTVLDMGGGNQMVLVGVTLTAQVQASIFVG